MKAQKYYNKKNKHIHTITTSNRKLPNCIITIIIKSIESNNNNKQSKYKGTVN